MELSPKPSHLNKQGKTITASPPSTIYRLPQRSIAVTHQKIVFCTQKVTKVNMSQSQFQQSRKASIQPKTSNSDPSTLHIIDSPSSTMAQPKKNELWGHGLLQLPTTIGMTDLNPPSKELQDQRSKTVDDRVEAFRLVREDDKERDVQEEKIKRLTAELETEKEALAFMESEIKSAFAKAASTTTIDRLEQEITNQQSQPSDTQIKLEQHRQHGKAFVKGMNTKYNFKDWSSKDSQDTKSTTGSHDTTPENRNLGTQTSAILYAFFDIPNYFREDELGTLLGYAHGNNNVKQAIQRMTDKNLLVSQKDSTGTEKYYLSKWSSEFAGRSPEDNPDIETTNPIYTNFINLRMQAGRTLINSRKKPKTPPQATVTTPVTLAVAVAGAEAQAKRKLELDLQEPKKKSKRKAANTNKTSTEGSFDPNLNDNLNSNTEPTAKQTIAIPDSSSSDYEETDSDNTPKGNNDTGFMDEDVFDPIIPAAKNKGTDFGNVRSL